LHNAVMPVGQTFLEVVSPVREGTTAGRLLDRRGGDGGYMVILQTADLRADRTRLAALGVRIVWQVELDDIATVHLHPRDLGGAERVDRRGACRAGVTPPVSGSSARRSRRAPARSPRGTGRRRRTRPRPPPRPSPGCG